MVPNETLNKSMTIDDYPIAAIKAQLKKTMTCAFCKKHGAATVCCHPRCNSKKRCEHDKIILKMLPTTSVFSAPIGCLA